MTPSNPSLFQVHRFFLFLNCFLSFNSWNKTLPIFHPGCENWLLRLGRDLNDFWEGQRKFKFKMRHCAVLQTQPCLLFPLRAILSQRETEPSIYTYIYPQRENFESNIQFKPSKHPFLFRRSLCRLERLDG